jgi:hypothetical protein
MVTVSMPIDERTRKNEQIILKGLASVGMLSIATHIGVDESTVCRWKEKMIGQLAGMLAVCGLKVVPVTVRCFDPADIDAILHQAHKYMESVRTADQLGWED